MMVLVDTPVWSLALRRHAADLRPEQKVQRQALADLISGGQAQLLGSVRQELLSGLRGDAQFRRLRDYLRAFDDVGLKTEDYEDAARMSNQCRAHGVAATPVDVLICAVADRRRWAIFTVDRDYVQYAKHLAVRFYRPR
jgi:predicted nucleic acid-binding protein